MEGEKKGGGWEKKDGVGAMLYTCILFGDSTQCSGPFEDL